MANQIVIIVEPELKSNCYRATIVGKPKTCGLGESCSQAIGSLVLAHREEFGIEIQTPTDSGKKD